MDRLIELAELCEKASGADRELDCLICAAVGTYSTRRFFQWCGMRSKGAPEGTLGDYLKEIAPAYTASLDSTMSLVPEGWAHGYEHWPTPDEHARGDKMRSRAWVKECSEYRVGRQVIWGHGDTDKMIETHAATPALALCAAALRARAYIEGNPTA